MFYGEKCTDFEAVLFLCDNIAFNELNRCADMFGNGPSLPLTMGSKIICLETLINLNVNQRHDIFARNLKRR